MRLIDADTLRAEFTGNFQNAYTPGEIWAIIDLAPTVDAVEVVRCVGCKHSEPSLKKNCVYCAEVNDRAVRRDWYCSDRERKA